MAVLPCGRMATEETRGVDDALLIEEADAWFEYLEAVRTHATSGRYDEVEPWAWVRLSQRLERVAAERSRLNRAAA